MNPLQVKIFLLKQGLTVSGIARELCKDSNTKFSSMRTMIDDTIHGRKFYPAIAAALEDKFGIKIERPQHAQPICRILRQAA